jgi:hypothetical protein
MHGFETSFQRIPFTEISRLSSPLFSSQAFLSLLLEVNHKEIYRFGLAAACRSGKANV